MVRMSIATVALTTRMEDDYAQPLLADQIAVMLDKEDAFYSRTDYLGELPESDNDFIDKGWRQKAAAWMFRVIDAYNLDRDIVSECWPYIYRCSKSEHLPLIHVSSSRLMWQWRTSMKFLRLRPSIMCGTRINAALCRWHH